MPPQLPTPGTLLRATRRMRGWEFEDEKGHNGPWVKEGDIAVVIQAWCVGNAVRLRLIIGGFLCVFSCGGHNLAINWQPVATG